MTAPDQQERKPYILFRPEGCDPFVPVPPDLFWSQLQHQLDYDDEDRYVFEVKVAEFTQAEIDALDEFTGW